MRHQYQREQADMGQTTSAVNLFFKQLLGNNSRTAHAVPAAGDQATSDTHNSVLEHLGRKSSEIAIELTSNWAHFIRFELPVRRSTRR